MNPQSELIMTLFCSSLFPSVQYCELTCHVAEEFFKFAKTFTKSVLFRSLMKHRSTHENFQVDLSMSGLPMNNTLELVSLSQNWSYAIKSLSLMTQPVTFPPDMRMPFFQNISLRSLLAAD